MIKTGVSSYNKLPRKLVDSAKDTSYLKNFKKYNSMQFSYLSVKMANQVTFETYLNSKNFFKGLDVGEHDTFNLNQPLFSYELSGFVPTT